MARPRKQARSARFEGGRAVIYIRVSTDEQKKGFGPEAQREVCDRHLAAKGYELVEVTEDLGISGTKGLEKRPGLQRAVQLCEDDAADVIVVYEQDRLSRSSAVWELLVERAKKVGYRLETARDGMVLTTEENEMPADMRAFMAAWERKMIVARLRGGRKQRAKVDGRGSSYVPFGYCKTGTGVEVYPPQAKIVRKLFSLRDAGKTYRDTAAALNALSMKAPKGGEWTAGQVAWIERHRALYETGARTWSSIPSAQAWPTILRQREEVA